MTALLWHTVLTVVLIGWAYEVASRVPYKPAWIWFGSGLVIVLGYLAVIAVSVFDGSPARVQVIVGNVAATLMALAGILCLALFAAVSRGPRQSVAARGAARADVSGWAPRDDDPVIVPDDAEDWESGAMIDSGTWPPDPGMDVESRPGRYALAPTDDVDGFPRPARARDAGPSVESEAPPATAASTPVAPPPVAASAWEPATEPDEEPRERSAPRRALPPSESDDEL